MEAETFRLYRGNDLLGTLVMDDAHTFPWFSGRFEATPAFAAVEDLFREATSHAAAKNIGAWCDTFMRIDSPSLKVKVRTLKSRYTPSCTSMASMPNGGSNARARSDGARRNRGSLSEGQKSQPTAGSRVDGLRMAFRHRSSDAVRQWFWQQGRLEGAQAAGMSAHAEHVSNGGP